MDTKPSLQIKPAAMRWYNALLREADQRITSSVIEMTPDKAAVLLSRNEDNRNIRESKSAQYESDMRNGRFTLNGEPIIVAKNGMLNDGQHRLWACIRSGKSFQTVIVAGVERDTRYTIDIGAAKSAGDHLSFQKVQNASTAAAIARFVIVWEREGNLNKRSQVSAAEQIERVTKDELIREIAGWIDTQRYRMKNMIKGSLCGTLYYLFAQKTPLEAKAFMESFRDGANLDAKSPIYLLREKLMQDEKMTDMAKMEAVIRAWNHWLRGPTTKITRLQIMGTIPPIGEKISEKKHAAANA